MTDGLDVRPEIESFNLTDLDVSALDVRLELTTLVPHIRVCFENCSTNCSGNCSVLCDGNGYCNCHSYN